MSKKIIGTALATALIMSFSPSLSSAHTALFSCYDLGDGTIECEGGFSNGASASGVKVSVNKAADNSLIQDAALNEDSLIVITKPDTPYTVTMNAGEGHTVTIKSSEITE